MPLHRPLAPWHLHPPLPLSEYTHRPPHAHSPPSPRTPLVLAVNRTPQFTIFTSRKDRNCTPSSAPGHSHPPSSLHPLTSPTAPHAHQPPGAAIACHRVPSAPLNLLRRLRVPSSATGERPVFFHSLETSLQPLRTLPAPRGPHPLLSAPRHGGGFSSRELPGSFPH